MTFTSIPFVVGQCSRCSRTSHSEVEEADFSLGARPWQVFAFVVGHDPAAFIAGTALSFAAA
jgi:sulfate transport system permease protein